MRRTKSRTSRRPQRRSPAASRGRALAKPGEEQLSPLLRCRGNQWYRLSGAAEAKAKAEADAETIEQPGCITLLARFFADEEHLGCRRIELHHVANGAAGEWLGWFLTPPRSTHLRLETPLTAGDLNGAPPERLRQPEKLKLPEARIPELTLRKSAERDPKCHPLANVPRWQTLANPRPGRILLPASLAAILPDLEGLSVEILPMPAGPDALAALLTHAVAVLDPAWATAWSLTAADLERLAARGTLVVDLETAAFALQRSGAARTAAVTCEAARQLFSARVEYSDGPTRGFALQDVLPFTFAFEGGALGQRALTANRSWQRYARSTGCATLLSSETPWEEHHADVLTAAQPCGQGELLITDVPWLAAGLLGRPLAPRILRHLLRMHLGAPLQDGLQFWTAAHDALILTRDIVDLSRRYPPLQAVRWLASTAAPPAPPTPLRRERLSTNNGAERPAASRPESPPIMRTCLGVTAAGPSADNGRPARGLLIRSGSIDESDPVVGVPPEPMILLMKWLARELREETRWARQRLTGRYVTWQYETRLGAKYSVLYDAAPPLPADRILDLRIAQPGQGHRLRPARTTESAPGSRTLVLPFEGLYGDGSIEIMQILLSELDRALRSL